LAGEIDIHLDISTAEHENAKAQELAFMLQTMGNNMPQDLSQVILSDIARLRKMPDLAKRIAEFQPQPDPMQQQMAQLEMQKLQAEVMKLQAEAQKIQADGMLDMAKVDTENAKAGNLQAEKDARDLDFLEEESGTKHQRELEKSMAQAKGNIEMHERDAQNKAQLEVLKSLMKRDEQPRTGSQAAGLENL
jgi:hypothetical protein